MLTFKSVTQRDLTRLRRYYEHCDYRLCEYSALVKLLWREHLRLGGGGWVSAHLQLHRRQALL